MTIIFLRKKRFLITFLILKNDKVAYLCRTSYYELRFFLYKNLL